MACDSPGMCRKRINTPAGGSSAAKELGEEGRDVCRHREQKCLFPCNERIGPVGWSCCVPTLKPLGSEWHFTVLMAMRNMVGKGKKLNKVIKVVVAISWSWF